MTDTVVAEDKESDTSSGAALGAIIYILYIYNTHCTSQCTTWEIFQEHVILKKEKN